MTSAAMLSGVREFFVQAEAFVGRAICGLSGHSMVLHFEPRRLSLECVLCGYETTGWEVAPGPPRASQRGTRHTTNDTPQSRRESRSESSGAMPRHVDGSIRWSSFPR